MRPGLADRRVAVFFAPDAASVRRAELIRRALEGAGASVHELGPVEPGEAFHSGRYAALVLVGGEGASAQPRDDRLTQLIREFLVADKPVAALGAALATLLESGGVAGRRVAASPALTTAVTDAGAEWLPEPVVVDGVLVTGSDAADVADFAARAIGTFATALEDRALDTMSDLSFPASDPPSTSPGTAGPAGDLPDRGS